MSDLPPCAPDIFKNGHSICTIDGCSHRVEEWVKAVAKESGQRVDWHYSGGIANVLYLGDYAAVAKAVALLGPELPKEPPVLPGECCRCRAYSSTPRTTHAPCRMLSILPPDAHGPYRDGDALPDDVIGVSST